MTNEELALAIQKGAPKMAELWERTEKLIVKAARRYYGEHKGFCQAVSLEAEDLVQEGYLALADAVDAYDPKKGYVFFAYLKYPLKKRFSRAAGFSKGNAKLFINRRSLDQPLAGGAVFGELIEDKAAEQTLLDVEEKIYLEQLRQALEQRIGALPTSQAAALRARYWGDGGEAESRHWQAGLRNLRKRQNAQYLEEYREFIIEHHGYGGTLELFRNTWTSSTERAVLELDKRGLLRA